MLQLLDESLEGFLRAEVPLGARDIDVAFDAPDKDWAAQLSRPTVNLFLWDMSRASPRMESGMETVTIDGKVMRRWAPIPIDFRYLVTAWTAEHNDEHQLLGNLLRTILANRSLPNDYMAGGLGDLGEVTMSMSSSGDRVQTDLWRAFDGQLKPGIEVVLTMYVDTESLEAAGPPTTGLDLATTDLQGESGEINVRRRVAGQVEDPAAVDALVRSPHGVTKVNEAGMFLIQAEPGDEIVVDTDPPKSIIVPESGGVVLS